MMCHNLTLLAADVCACHVACKAGFEETLLEEGKRRARRIAAEATVSQT